MIRLRTLFIIIIATHLWMIPRALHAQAGNAGLAFLKLGVSARGVSMGDAMSALADGAVATHYNPAGVFSKDISSAQVLLMHKEWIQDVRSEFLGASIALGEASALGISINTTTVSDIEIRSRPGTPEGTFTSRDYSLGATYAHQISDDLKIGVSGKFLFEKIFVDEATGYGIDIGAQYRTPIENLSVGLAVQNLGALSEMRTEKLKLPTLARLGPAYSFAVEDMNSNVTLAADLLHIFPEKKSYVGLGGEVLFNSTVAARFGYQLGSNARGVSAGLGVRHGMFAVDYAFIPLSSDLGSGHTFSVLLNL
ncbi:MAG: PorV/PorQ family protein [Ignavibacteriae bacterium]|nr:PorV/PorQ family protein [Ignavibacteriota bacterium]